MEDKKKYGLNILNAEMYAKEPTRYKLIEGSFEGAPLCPYGNHFKWIVLDTESKHFMRATSSVFKKLMIKNQS